MDNHTDIIQILAPAMNAVEQLEKEFHPESRAIEHSRLSDAVKYSKEGDTSGVVEALERKFTPKEVTNKDFQTKLDADFTRHCIKCPSANKEVFRTDEIERFTELITLTETAVGKEHSRTIHCIETAKAYTHYLQASAIKGNFGSNLKKGRPSIQPKDFKEYLSTTEPENTMTILHECINGKKGKNVAIAIRALIEAGLIENPPPAAELYKSMRGCFGDIGANSGIDMYNTGMGKNRINDDVDRLVKRLLSIK